MIETPEEGFAEIPDFAQALFKALPGYSLLLKNDGPRYTIVASTQYYLLEPGVSASSLYGRGVFEAFPPNASAPEDKGESDLRASLDYIATHKKAHHLQVHRYDVRHRDGSFLERYWRAENSPVFSSSGEVSFIIHTTEDVTDQVRAGQLEEKMRGLEVEEQAIRRRESNLRNMIMQSPVAMSIFRGQEYIVEIANERMIDLLGKPRDEIIGRPIFEGVPEARNQGYEDLLQHVFTTGHSFSAYGTPINLFRAGRAQTLYLNLLYEPFRDEGGKITGIMVVALDVTEQELARRSLARSEARARLAVNSAHLGTFDINLAVQTIEYSERTAEIFDFPTTPEIPYRSFLERILPEDAAIRRAAHEQGKISGALLYEVRIRITDGSIRWIRVNGTYTSNPGTDDTIVGTILDITEERRASELLEQKIEARTRELATSVQELQRSNQHLEEFAHAASHDLKEPIRKVLTFCGRLKSSLGPRMNEEEADIFSRMERATERMGLLVEDLLEFSHVSGEPMAMDWVNLNDKLKNVLIDLELVIAEKEARILVGPLPTVLGYRRQLQQLFQNLVSNAIKYSKPGVEPEITIRWREVRGGAILPNLPAEQREVQYHLIEVEDNGIGFEARYAERIFAMFQRLHGKTEYEGTGVGLSIAKKVVENHNGHIVASSAPGQGSIFKVLLPMNDSNASH